MSTRKARLVLLAVVPLLAGCVVVAPPAQYWPQPGNDAEAMGAALGAVLGAAVGQAGARGFLAARLRRAATGARVRLDVGRRRNGESRRAAYTRGSAEFSRAVG